MCLSLPLLWVEQSLKGNYQGKLKNNPKQNLSVTCLRSEKSYEEPSKPEQEEKVEKETEKVMVEKEADEDEGKETPKQAKAILKE